MWRIERHPSNQQLVVVACMHAGVRVVDVGRMEHAFHYDKQQTLAYGGTWGRNGAGGGDVVASCTFYDREVHLWEWESHDA